MNTPVSVMETAGEGGAWGIALLAAYCRRRKEGETLADYLEREVFSDGKCVQAEPDQEMAAGFEEFMEYYKKGLAVERAAVEVL